MSFAEKFQICQNCRCYEREKHGTWGYCHCNPPTLFPNEKGEDISLLPEVLAEGWCDQWKANAGLVAAQEKVASILRRIKSGTYGDAAVLENASYKNLNMLLKELGEAIRERDRKRYKK